MKTNIQFVRLKNNVRLANFTNEKLASLSHKYKWLIKAAVYIKEENDPSDKGKICEITLRGPGPEIFASSNETSFEAAIAETVRDLERQLKTRKAKMNPHL